MNRLEREKTKVAIVLPYFSYGGGERMVALLASHIDLSRFDLLVVCNHGSRQGNVMEEMVEDHGVRLAFVEKGLGFSLAAERRLWRILDRFKPDIVHTHLNTCMFCAPWCVANRVKMLHTIHNIPEKEATSKFRQYLMKFMFRHGFAIPVAISEENRRLTSKFYSLEESSVEVVVNPVDIEQFSNRKKEQPRFDFLNVARLGAQKNQKLLIESIFILKSKGVCLHGAIVGVGPLQSDLVSYCDELGLQEQIEFLGKRDDVADLMGDSKLFVLSSDYEGLPMSILEAMAVGLPIVSTDVGGVADVVQNNGLLVPPGNARALAFAIESVLASDEEADNMATASLEAVKRYDVYNVAALYEFLYLKYGKRA